MLSMAVAGNLEDAGDGLRSSAEHGRIQVVTGIMLMKLLYVRACVYAGLIQMM